MPASAPNLLVRALRLRSLLIVNAVVLALIGAAFAREYVRSREIKAEIAALEADTRRLEARNLEIGQLATLLQSESSIEREARLKLGFKKPGESVVIVKRDEAIARAADATVAIDPSTVPNPSKWWRYFFDQESYRTLVRK